MAARLALIAAVIAFALANLTFVETELQIGYAVVLPDSGSPVPAGSALFSFHDRNGVLIWEAGIAASRPINTGTIFIDQRGAWTGMALVNLEDQAVSVAFLLRDSSGLEIGRSTRTFSPKQHIAIFVQQLFDKLPADFIGSLTFSAEKSGQRLAAVTLRQTQNYLGEDIYTTLPVIDLSASANSGPAVYPQIGAGNDLSTQLILVNPTDVKLAGKIKLTSSDGNPLVLNLDGIAGSEFGYQLNPRAVYRGELTKQGATSSGYCLIEAQQGGTVPSGSAIFRYRTAGGIVTEAGVGEVAPTNAARIYVDNVETYTGVAIACPSTSTNVTFKLFSSGDTAAAQTTRRLPDKGHLAIFVHELFPGMQESFVGMLEITSSAPIVPITMKLTINARNDLVLTTLPIADLTRPTSDSLKVLPHVAFGAGYSTKILLIDPDRTVTLSGRLSFYQSDGSPMYLPMKDQTGNQFAYLVKPQLGQQFEPQIAGATGLATISGTVRGPSGPVANILITAGSKMENVQARTNNSGFYTLSIRADSYVSIRVRPDTSLRLAGIQYWIDKAPPFLTKNFYLDRGYLLEVRWLDQDRSAVQPRGGVSLEPMRLQPSGYSLFTEWDPAARVYRAVLPPDIYYLTAQNPRCDYCPTTHPVDLRRSDQSLEVPLNTAYVHPIPYDPPDASKIRIGPPDGLGEATVTGNAGAALPLARVLLVNLNSSHQADTVSETDGGFTARIYAPPGSDLMIKHGPPGWRWNALSLGLTEGVNPFSGTIIHVPHAPSADSSKLPFAAVGAVETGDMSSTASRRYVASAWAMSGTMNPVVVEGRWTRVMDGTYGGQSAKGLYLGGLNWTHPSLVDIDGDGDLDLMVGERSGQIVMYRNQGTRTAPDWQFEKIGYAGVSTGNWAYPVFADITNDGAPDLFVGTGNGSVLIYINRGTRANAVWPGAPDMILKAPTSAAPALADLDGDGDLDMIVGGTSSSLVSLSGMNTQKVP